MTSHERIHSTVERCRRGFDSGVTRSLDWRRNQLKALERMLSSEGDAFSQAMFQDFGKPPHESWITEISFVSAVSRHARKHLGQWARGRTVRTPVFAWPGSARIQPEPLGTILIIAPWNYPLQLCLAPLVTAIAAGNAAVIKPSEHAPALSAALAERLPRYLDPDCFAVIEGGASTSSRLLEMPWGHIVFTGGEHVARIVMSAAAKTLTPVTLELGGKTPCVVLPDANMEVAARRIAWGRFTNAGQTCIAPDHILSDRETRDRLIPLIQAEITNMFGDDPSQSPDYGRISNAAHFDRLRGLMENAPVVAGGRADPGTRYIEPTLISPASPELPCMQEEIFGPLLPFVVVEDAGAAIRFIAQGPKPLAAYLFTSDRAAKKQFEREVSAGSITVNDVMVFMGITELPFGGVGASGMGRYNGEAGFRNLSHQKSILRRAFFPELNIRYAPMNESKLKWISRLR